MTDIPLGCQIPPELLKMVCSKYWKCKTSKGSKLLYSVDDATLNAHAMLSQKLDAQQFLFKRLNST